MSTILKIFAAVFICVAGVFLYVVSFSLEAVLSLAALAALIMSQIFFLSRRAKIKQYKNSNLSSKPAENSTAPQSSDLHGKKAKNKAKSRSSVDRKPLEKSTQSPAAQSPATGEIKENLKPEPSSSGEAPKSEAKAPAGPSPDAEDPKAARKQSPKKAGDETQNFQKELETTLMAVQKYLDQKQYKEGLKLIDDLLERRNYTFHNIEQIISALKIKGDCEFYLKNHEKAFRIWMLLFNKDHLEPAHPRFFPILEDIVEKCDKQNMEQGSYFLMILLNQYRQNDDLEKMDETYYKLEKIHRMNKDHEHLLKVYQGHIAVKEKQDDVPGQIQLLDSLGKLYYHQGDAEYSKKCYEQRMTLEKRLEKQPETQDLTATE